MYIIYITFRAPSFDPYWCLHAQKHPWPTQLISGVAPSRPAHAEQCAFEPVPVRIDRWDEFVLLNFVRLDGRVDSTQRVHDVNFEGLRILGSRLTCVVVCSSWGPVKVSTMCRIQIWNAAEWFHCSSHDKVQDLRDSYGFIKSRKPRTIDMVSISMMLWKLV